MLGNSSAQAVKTVFANKTSRYIGSSWKSSFQTWNRIFLKYFMEMWKTEYCLRLISFTTNACDLRYIRLYTYDSHLYQVPASIEPLFALDENFALRRCYIVHLKFRWLKTRKTQQWRKSFWVGFESCSCYCLLNERLVTLLLYTIFFFSGVSHTRT